MLYSFGYLVHPPDFMSSILQTLETLIPIPKKSPVIIELSKKSMCHNSRILKRHNYVLEKLIE